MEGEWRLENGAGINVKIKYEEGVIAINFNHLLLLLLLIHH
jgi:hypothetical protein